MKVIGVSFDSPADNAAFAKKFNFPFPLISDTGRKLGMAYGACDSAKDEYARRIAYVILIGYALLMFIPFVWSVVTAFKTLPDSVRLTIVPNPFTPTRIMSPSPAPRRGNCTHALRARVPAPSDGPVLRGACLPHRHSEGGCAPLPT